MPICSRIFPAFSSSRFSISGLMAGFLTHLEMDFVQDNKDGPVLFLLHADNQCVQQHVLKMLSFSSGVLQG